jgi:PHP family Zn ribbon phosphoesterase
VPEQLNCDALELSQRATIAAWSNNPKLPAEKVFVQNSDAHVPEDIGKQFTVFEMEQLSFEEMKKALERIKYTNLNTTSSPILGGVKGG